MSHYQFITIKLYAVAGGGGVGGGEGVKDGAEGGQILCGCNC